MTSGLEPLVETVANEETQAAYFTAPGGPPSINSDADAAVSAEVCLPHLLPLLDRHDAFLVACYSEHPLVPQLKSRTRKPVTGIFEASVITSLALIQPSEGFGIVTTGEIWNHLLTKAVSDFLGAEKSPRFIGVETTGLNATELHDASPKDVKKRIQDATRRLLSRGNIGAICLGCVGMSGMDEWVREVCQKEDKTGVLIVDGVIAGFSFLKSALSYL